MEPIVQNNFSFYLKPARILFFKTDINERDPDNAFLYMARTAQKFGNDVDIFTTSCKRRVLNAELKNVTVHQVGQYIPKDIFGWCRTIMYMIRTIYMLLWFFIMRKDLNPTFVVIHNSMELLVFFKLIARCTVVQIYTFKEEEMLKATFKGIIRKRNYIQNLLMRLADEIIVLDRLSRTVLMNAFKYTLSDKPPTVHYPCIFGSAFEKSPIIPLGNIMDVKQDVMMLVCFGPMRPTSNFELCIQAFSLVLNKARISNSYIYYNTILVIASQYRPTKEYDRYCSKLENLSQSLCGYRPSVVILHESPLTYRKTLMSRCEAVLVPMVCLNARTILEVSAMKKPVIAINCGIASELITEGQNGFLPQNDAYEFAKCMLTVLYNGHQQYDASEQIFQFYQENFGLPRYVNDFKEVVARNSPLT